MALIKSISGTRGTIGGNVGENLTPVDIVKFTAAFITFIKTKNEKEHIRLVVGRDARVSGQIVNQLVTATAMSMGADVIDLGLSTTPTVEMAVVFHKADCGLIITASHNPMQWNALKMLNEKGEFINAAEGKQVLRIAEADQYTFATVDALGTYTADPDAIKRHIEAIINLPLVDKNAIAAADFSVVIDCINSTGSLALPPLLEALGVKKVMVLNGDLSGKFAHNPEPLPEHLSEIATTITRKEANVGFVVDPDVDRLACVCETGDMFGEEYTLVAVADYVLSHTKGNTVSNLSSSRALADVTHKYGCDYNAAAVGEVNVVEKMKETNAIIGGEGNGGVIYPELHYGRDALVGIALFLSHLAKSNCSCSALRAKYPAYYISKNKITLDDGINVDFVLDKIAESYKNERINRIDGVKIDFDSEWVHLRKSNTEPIIRIYAEANSEVTANHVAEQIINDIHEIIKSENIRQE